MDPSRADAASILEYVEQADRYAHPRRKARRKERELESVFVRIETSLPPGQIAPWAGRLDPFIEWLRALHGGVRSEPVRDALKKLAQDEQERVRRTALHSLRKLK